MGSEAGFIIPLLDGVDAGTVGARSTGGSGRRAGEQLAGGQPERFSDWSQLPVGSSPHVARPATSQLLRCLSPLPAKRVRPSRTNSDSDPRCSASVGRDDATSKEQSGGKSGSHPERLIRSDDSSQWKNRKQLIGWRPDHPGDLRGRWCPRTLIIASLIMSLANNKVTNYLAGSEIRIRNAEMERELSQLAAYSTTSAAAD